MALDRPQQSGAQQLGQLPGIDTLVAGFQQGVPPWIAHHDFRDVRLYGETGIRMLKELSRSYLTGSHARHESAEGAVSKLGHSLHQHSL